MGDRAPSRPLVAISEEAHSSVGKALRVLGVDALLVPCDDHRMTGAGLVATLDAHPRADDVIAVVATGGTTNAGIIDDLAGVGTVARDRSLWFHVDGAYGCAALFAPSIRRTVRRHRAGRLVRGGPAQMALRPVRLRRPPLPGAAVGQGGAHPGRLLPRRDARAATRDDWNPSDYAYHLTRRARGLPLWFSLAVYGTDAYRDAIETVLTVTQQTADLVERAPHLELVRRPELSVVLFRRAGWGWDDYERWSARLLKDQVGFVVPTVWEDQPVGRLALLHPDTTLAMIEEIIATMA